MSPSGEHVAEMKKDKDGSLKAIRLRITMSAGENLEWIHVRRGNESSSEGNQSITIASEHTSPRRKAEVMPWFCSPQESGLVNKNQKDGHVLH